MEKKRKFAWRQVNKHKAKLNKPDKCEMCMKKEKLHGHHTNYKKPLEVIWLCVSCHSTIHAKVAKRNAKGHFIK